MSEQQKQKSIKDMIKEELIKCKLDPVYFMKRYCMIQHPVKGRMPFKLYPYQEDLMKAFVEYDRNIILKSRQLGISTLSAGYILWLMIFHEDKNILVVAIDQATSKNLVTKVHVMLEYLPSWLKPKTTESNKLSIRLTNGSQVKAVASTGTSGRSEALSLLIIDEAAFVQNAEELWASAQQTLGTGGRAIVLSTPNGTGNFFHKLWMKAESGEAANFKATKLPWWVHPDRDQDWRDRQDDELGLRLAAQECDCDFSTSGQTVVHPQILTWYSETFIQEPVAKRGFDGNMWVWENADYTKSYIVTADVARGDGGDYSAFHIIDVEDCRQVAEYKGQVTTKDYGNLLVAVATEYNDALLVVENANVGWATIQTIIDRGYKNLYYTYKDNVFDPETYLHKQYDLSNRSDGVAGFSMTQKIRPLAVSKLDLYMREKECIIRSKRLLDELYVFVWKNSRAEAQHGYNDDLVMSWMQGLWVRDTALKLRQSGIDLTKMSLNHFRNSKTEAAIYSTKNFGPNPYKVNLGGGNEEDISWLLGG